MVSQTGKKLVFEVLLASGVVGILCTSKRVLDVVLLHQIDQFGLSSLDSGLDLLLGEQLYFFIFAGLLL